MHSSNIQKKLQGLNCLIGNTPILEISFRYRSKVRKIYAKAENFNLTGSIKDRMALHILKKAYSNGDIKHGCRIVEATSGNTWISFSAIGSLLGHQVTIFMPDWLSEERKNLIKSYGANIELVSKEQGGFLGSIEMTRKLKEDDDHVFLPCQFSNSDNIEAHYLTTGPEIWNQLEVMNLKIDAVVAGVGTGGTIMGLSKYLRERNPHVKAYPLEPSNSPTLSTGHKIGTHRIQGISDEFIPEIVELDKLDDIIQVDDGDAIIMAQYLSCRLGLGVGISSGANFLGALLVQEKLDTDSVIVTVFPDDSKKYLSTDLMKEEPIKDHFLTKNIELLEVTAHTIR